ncbi:MAG: saccharopine dehydrogenase C-terminal domain-containing protein [Anaerolineales bacterium]
MPNMTYAILGAGRQGTAAAYDLARHSNAVKILFFDIHLDAAQTASKRINQLTGTEIATAHSMDVSDSTALVPHLSGVDVTLSAVPYQYNLNITKACIQAGSSLCDMGGHTGVVKDQLGLDEKAKSAGVSIVPDCGMGPGLNITMAVYVKDIFDDPQHISIYDGGLPQTPEPPWNYNLTFHINGLTNEMDGHAFFIRQGKVTPVDTLTEAEFIEFEPLGRLEADVTSGGLSTSPWAFEGELESYENKTLRYPGHFEWLRAYKALGLFSEDPLEVGHQQVIPRQVYHRLLEPKIRDDDVRDICLIRVVGRGEKEGKKKTLVCDLVDHYDQETGFTAMERLTGWHCAIMMGFQASGNIKPGCHPVHSAVSAGIFMEALEHRGIHFSLREDGSLK